MRQYSCITIVAVIIILVMQVLYIQSLYHNYKDSVASDIEDSLYVAMDREYHWRMRIARNKEPEKQHVMRYKLRSDMTPEEIDSLQRIDKDSIVMDMAIARNLGKTVSDMVAQIRQDIALEKGYPIRLHVLDSIFSGMTAKKIPYLISVLDKEKNVKASCGTLAEHAGYVYPLFPNRHQRTAIYQTGNTDTGLEIYNESRNGNGRFIAPYDNGTWLRVVSAVGNSP